MHQMSNEEKIQIILDCSFLLNNDITMKLGYRKLSVNKLTDLEFQCRRHLYNICKIYIFFMYIIILAINCHSLFCLWVVSPLQCQSSILVFILFIYVLYVTNHQNPCKCKMQMSVILCSHGLLDWFNKTILFYFIL